jgi:branched-chain amino acid aminotransferase
MKEIVYLNGHLINADEAGINPADSGFLYGAGLFETMRAYSGKIFLLDRHIERLVSSAQALGIDAPDTDSLIHACNTAVAANELESARVRLTVTSGNSGKVSVLQPTVLVQPKPYTPRLMKCTRRATVVSSHRQNVTVCPPWCGIKQQILECSHGAYKCPSHRIR